MADIIGPAAEGVAAITVLVIAIVLGVPVHGENIAVTTLAGIALVLAGVALTRRYGAGSGQ